MSDRFERLFTLGAPLYSKGCPVIVTAGALLKDNKTGNVLAQIKFQNIGEEVIKAVSVSIKALDAAGRAISETVPHNYLDLSASRDAFFGQKEVIVVPLGARGFEVTVIEVVFNDNHVWTADACSWALLPSQRRIKETLDNDLADQYLMDVCKDAVFEFAEGDGIWLCSCGAINATAESKCHKCGTDLAVFKSLDLDSLNQKKNDRIEQAAKERAEIEELKVRKNKKTKRIVSIVLPAIVIIVALSVITTKIIIPTAKYKKAEQLANNGEYEEAISAFTALGEYKDSVERIKDCNYRIAVDLYDSGNYTTAIEKFTVLEDYLESNSYIEKCRNGILDNHYNDAIRLFMEGDYTSAINAFKNLNGYRDSDLQIEKCQDAYYKQRYSNCERLFAAGEYKAAKQELFYLPDGYEGKAEYISKCDYKISEQQYATALEFYNTGDYSKALTALSSVDVPFPNRNNLQLDIYKHDPALLSPGNTIYIGTHTTVDNTNIEPVAWVVLASEGTNRFLVLSRDALVKMALYSVKDVKREWSNCSVRTWLNNQFYNNAFSNTEKQLITVTSIEGVRDRVYCLSVEEAKQYSAKINSLNNTSQFWSRSFTTESRYGKDAGKGAFLISPRRGGTEIGTEQAMKLTWEGYVRAAMWIEFK